MTMSELVPVFQFGGLAAARQAEQNALSDDDPWVRSDAHAGTWLRDGGFRPSTREQYDAAYQSWRTWCQWTDVPPLEAKRTDVTAYTLFLEKRGNPAARTPRPLGSRSIARHMAILSSYYAMAVEEEKIPRNPVPSHARPKVSSKSAQPHLERDENRALLAAADADGPRSAALVALLLLACLRVSEALSATIENLIREKGGDSIRVVRKGNNTESVALPLEAVERIRAAIGSRKRGPIIATATGRPMDRKAAWKTIRRLGRAAGLTTPIGPHTLRHAYITRGHEMGVPVADLQKAAGHQSVDTTRGYDRSGTKAARAASATIAHDLAGPEEKADPMFRTLLRSQSEDRTYALWASRPADEATAKADAARHNQAGKLGLVAFVMSDASYEAMTFDPATGRMTVEGEPVTP